MFILPFANEIANALTLSKILSDTPFRRLYEPCDPKLEPIIQSNTINSIALFGIIWNVSYMGSKHGTKMGCIYGTIVVLLSFVIPNAFMKTIVNSLPDTGRGYTRMLGAFGFILVLLSIEIVASKYLRSLPWKYSRYSKVRN